MDYWHGEVRAAVCSCLEWMVHVANKVIQIERERENKGGFGGAFGGTTGALGGLMVFVIQRVVAAVMG